MSAGRTSPDGERAEDKALFFSLEGRGKEKHDYETKYDKAQAGREVEQTARTVATNSWTTKLVRLGYAVKGVVYLIIGGVGGTTGSGPWRQGDRSARGLADHRCATVGQVPAHCGGDWAARVHFVELYPGGT